MPWDNQPHQGESWSSDTMAVTAHVRIPPVTIHLDERTPIPTAHRLTELVQALSGCTVEQAELAVADPTPETPVTADDALEVVARALVQLRPRPS